jgi:uncharacterized membrane protein
LNPEARAIELEGISCFFLIGVEFVRRSRITSAIPRTATIAKVPYPFVPRTTTSLTSLNLVLPNPGIWLSLGCSDENLSRMSLSRELRDEGSNSARVRALSDGVFAIVLTFLIFRLDIGKLSDAGSDREVLNAIRDQAAPILGYFLSFFIIGGFWMMHQRVFRHISKFKRELYWLNLQFLFFLSILPLTTSIHAGNHQLRVGWWLYAGNVTVAGLGLLALWLRAKREGLLDGSVDSVVQTFYIWQLATIPLVFLFSILVSFSSVLAAEWIPLAVPLVSWVIHKIFAAQADSNVVHLDVAA